jgi:hypothetical protein
MSTSATLATSHVGGKYGGPFWERLWRLSGVTFILCFVAAYAICGLQPRVGASTDALAAFYRAGRTHVLIGAVLIGMAVLNLLWFAAALRAALAEAGQDGWGGAATASSTAAGAMLLLLAILAAPLALSIAGTGNQALISGLNDISWSVIVMSAFPRAMLIMAGSFGFWRAGMISNAVFAACVAAIVLTLLGGTTWFSAGAWAPDGPYSRFVSPAIGILWVLFATRILLSRSPGTGRQW